MVDGVAGPGQYLAGPTLPPALRSPSCCAVAHPGTSDLGALAAMMASISAFFRLRLATSSAAALRCLAAIMVLISTAYSGGGALVDGMRSNRRAAPRHRPFQRYLIILEVSSITELSTGKHSSY